MNMRMIPTYSPKRRKDGDTPDMIDEGSPTLKVPGGEIPPNAIFSSENKNRTPSQIHPRNNDINDQHNNTNTTKNTNDTNNSNDDENQNCSNNVKILWTQLLKLFNLSIRTSTKFLSPAVSSILQRTIPPILHSLEEVTPLRIQHWVHIIYISYANTIGLFLNSPQGQIVTQNILSIMDQSMNLLTSVNTRQVLIDTMSFVIKSINVLQSQEVKAVITSIPILIIRIIDTMSSGEAKLFYHSIGNLCTSMIDFVNQEDMTVLMAEITARMVHALEMEHYHHLPLTKRRQWRNAATTTTTRNHPHHHKRKKVYIAGGKRMMMIIKRKAKHKRNKIHHDDQYYNHYYKNVMTDDQLYHAIEAQNRMKRNKYMNQTYNQKTLLHHYDHDEFQYHENHDSGDDDTTINHNGESAAMSFSHDRQVEDAILSSLSHDNTTTYSDNAWLTRLGRKDDGDDDDNDDNDDNDKLGQECALQNDTVERGKAGYNLNKEEDDSDDAMSLPSKVILNTRKSQEDNVDTQYSIASSLNLDDLEVQTNSYHNLKGNVNVEEEYDLVDVVDTSYLRSSLKMRKEKSMMNTNSKRREDYEFNQVDDVSDENVKHSTQKMEGITGAEVTNESDIEDLVNFTSQASTELRQEAVESTSKCTKKIRLNMSNDENSVKGVVKNKKYGRKHLPSYIKSKSKIQRKKDAFHVKEGSVQHFYRALDDIATMIRSQAVNNQLKDTADSKNFSKKWYSNAAAAAGLGNETGQDTLRSLLDGRGSGKPTRFQANIGVGTVHNGYKQVKDEQEQGVWKAILNMVLGQFTLKKKIFIGMVALFYVVVSFAWFIFGCYGIYRWFSGSGGSDVESNHGLHSSSQPINEYVIRIVQEVPKTAIMETVTKSLEDTVRSGNSNFAENLASAFVENNNEL